MQGGLLFIKHSDIQTHNVTKEVFKSLKKMKKEKKGKRLKKCHEKEQLSVIM